MEAKIVIRVLKLLLVFFPIILVISCKKGGEQKEKREVYYLYDIDRKFDRITDQKEENIIFFVYRPKKYYMVDTLKVLIEMPLYQLIYHYGDSSFIKHKSFLDEIEYFGYDWFKNDSNTIPDFWLYKYKDDLYDCDSLRIFKIDPIPGTDSVLVRKVGRRIHPVR